VPHSLYCKSQQNDHVLQTSLGSSQGRFGNKSIHFWSSKDSWFAEDSFLSSSVLCLICDKPAKSWSWKPRKPGKMHDFCFTIPYGLVIVIGGVIGYLRKGSVASLGGGVGTGLVLIFAGYLSLKAFSKGKNSFLGLAIETGKTLLVLFFACFLACFCSKTDAFLGWYCSLSWLCVRVCVWNGVDLDNLS